MKKTIAFVGQIALVAVVIFCIYYGIFSSFPEKVQMVIDAYYNPQIPENILIWSETVSGIIYLITTAIILTHLINSSLSISDLVKLFLVICLIFFIGMLFIYFYLGIIELFSGSTDYDYHYKQLLLISLFTVGVIISTAVAAYKIDMDQEKGLYPKNEEGGEMSYILIIATTPILHSYLLLKYGFTYPLVTAIFSTIIYYLIYKTILILYWSFKRLKQNH